jgi:hypothetical protein
MKKFLIITMLNFSVCPFSFSQPDKAKYPEPEFSNEVYFLNKDSMKARRLEKESSKMDTKMKMAGFGGGESGYTVEGEKSPVRIGTGEGLSFVFSTGASARKSSGASDSVMRVNGMDPAEMSDMTGGMSDPANSISLYKTESGKGQRKISMQKSPGMLGFGGKKAYLNDNKKKYPFSAKKIREGYWELIIDKSLAKGEYAFVVTGGDSGGGMDAVLFAFGID